MHNRLLAAVAIFSLTLISGAAFAGVLTVSSYSMDNGNGPDQAGTFDYFDWTYKPNNANAATTPRASLSGGTGLLTDGTWSYENWSSAPLQYVGWKYFDPKITFNFVGSQKVQELDLYVSGGTGGLVGLPATITVNGNPETFTTTPILWGWGGVDKLSILFGNSGLIGNSFIVRLNEGACSLYTDCVNYSPKTDPYYTDPRTNQQTTVETWLMLSEVQFLGSAVPELSTWAMMLLGFAAIGFVAYRRQKKITLSPVMA
jgi:hypothetical protein